jgi:hypothetical protein
VTAKFVHHDNAHSAHVIQAFLAIHNIPVVRQLHVTFGYFPT